MDPLERLVGRLRSLDAAPEIPVTDTVEDIPHPMDYIGTDNPVTIAHYRALSQVMRTAYDTILGHCPESAERTLAVRKLQECRMWANAAIALDGKRYRV